jgi:general secretion pathway protein I
MSRPDANGFSLIELLVALAVFSLAVMALINLAGENARAASALETRALASVVAENRAVEVSAAPAAPPVGVQAGEEEAGGRRWRWVRRVGPTPDPDVLRVDISVYEGEARSVAAELSILRARR